jgi:hypothetical protein
MVSSREVGYKYNVQDNYEDLLELIDNVWAEYHASVLECPD